MLDDYKKFLFGSYKKFTELISLDKRSLALFRISIAFTILWDLADRSRDLSAHYTDEGLMPRTVVLSDFWNYNWTSIYMMSGNFWVTWILFIINSIIALFLMIGFQTKLVTILSWFFVVSLQDRNILVCHGGDVLHRVVLFFGIFLPLGEVYSVDNALEQFKNRNKVKKNNNYVVSSVASLAFILQVLIMYFSAHKLKVGAEWKETYTATWLALQLDFFRRPIGDFFLSFPALCSLLTFLVLKWQLWGIIFFFSPLYSGFFRTFSVFGYFMMHLSFFLCLRLGQFGWVTTGTILALIPTYFWEKMRSIINHSRSKSRKEFKFYYEDECITCQRNCHYLKYFLILSESENLPLSYLPNLNREEPCQCGNHCNWDEENSFINFKKENSTGLWLVVCGGDGNVKHNWDAFLFALQLSPLWWPLEKLLKKGKITGMIINSAINHLHPHRTRSTNLRVQKKSFKEKSQRTSFRDFIEEFWFIFKIFLLNFTVGFFMMIQLSWNAGNLGYHDFEIPQNLKWIAWTTQIDQSWSMFAPRPPNQWWYYNIDAQLDDGQSVELFSKGALFTHIPNNQTWEKPNPFYIAFKNHRWFKYFENGINTSGSNQLLRLHFGRWICREYNKVHRGSEKLYKFSLWLISENDPDMDLKRSEIGKQILWNHICYDK